MKLAELHLATPTIATIYLTVSALVLAPHVRIPRLHIQLPGIAFWEPRLPQLSCIQFRASTSKAG